MPYACKSESSCFACMTISEDTVVGNREMTCPGKQHSYGGQGATQGSLSLRLWLRLPQQRAAPVPCVAPQGPAREPLVCTYSCHGLTQKGMPCPHSQSPQGRRRYQGSHGQGPTQPQSTSTQITWHFQPSQLGDQEQRWPQREKQE